METFAIILMIVAMLATLGFLFTGLISFARGGEFNKKYGNKLMRYRVLAQFIAIGLFVVAVLILKTGNG